MPGEEVLLLWPAVTLLGFLLLAALVVALGRVSTAQYEFERNAVQSRPVPAAVAAAEVVNAAGYASPIRRPRGRDILAACGQLKTASERARRSASVPVAPAA